MVSVTEVTELNFVWEFIYNMVGNDTFFAYYGYVAGIPALIGSLTIMLVVGLYAYKNAFPGYKLAIPGYKLVTYEGEREETLNLKDPKQLDAVIHALDKLSELPPKELYHIRKKIREVRRTAKKLKVPKKTRGKKSSNPMRR